MKFSQRIGKTQAEKLVQRESIDKDLRNGLWNSVIISFLDRVSYRRGAAQNTKNSNFSKMIVELWIHHFKQPVDQIPLRFYDTKAALKKWFFEAPWFRVFDFLEACAEYGHVNYVDSFIENCNFHLERENSAYRFVNKELTEITSREEVEEVESAITQSGSFGAVSYHLAAALSLMNDREKPDYRNSIKESISAVESLAKILSGNEKASLGQALKEIEKTRHLHSALKSAFSSLYGYTSDADGIRHALLEEPSISKADARFMLVSCSTFVNYLIELSGKQELTNQSSRQQ